MGQAGQRKEPLGRHLISLPHSATDARTTFQMVWGDRDCGAHASLALLGHRLFVYLRGNDDLR
jgi:hypothetical protein